MAFWIVFWKILFIVTLVLFAGLAVWVTIGGYFDIRRLFSDMDKANEAAAREGQESVR